MRARNRREQSYQHEQAAACGDAVAKQSYCGIACAHALAHNARASDDSQQHCCAEKFGYYFVFHHLSLRLTNWTPCAIGAQQADSSIARSAALLNVGALSKVR